MYYTPQALSNDALHITKTSKWYEDVVSAAPASTYYSLKKTI